MSGPRAAFIDRDGVVNELVADPVTGLPESPLHPESVALIPGAARALHMLSASGWLVVGVSNQPAAAKATIPVEQVKAVQARVLELLANEGVIFDAFCLCLHHPHGVVPRLRRDCRCRKPSPGMLLDAASEMGIDLRASWMIGDGDSDVLAGKAAGCRTVLIEHGDSGHKRTGVSGPDAVVESLAAAATLLLSEASWTLEERID